MATEACCTPAPPAEHFEQGTSTKFRDLDAYINPGLEKATSAIILISDVLGYNPPLLRKLADRCAAEGFFVIAPDLFHGDPYVPGDTENRVAGLPAWIAKHSPTDLTDMKAVIKQLKEQGIQKIGVTGCCWGGKVATCLAIEDEPLINAAVLFHPSFVSHDDVRSIKVPVLFSIPEFDQQVPPEKAAEFRDILASRPEGMIELYNIFRSVIKRKKRTRGKVATCLAIGDEPLIDAAVLFHPSLLSHDDVRAIKVPVLFAIPEVDQQVPPEKAAEWKDILASKPEAGCNLKIFPGMIHGFCIRYDVNSPEEVKSATESHADMLEWYKKYLKV